MTTPNSTPDSKNNKKVKRHKGRVYLYAALMGVLFFAALSLTFILLQSPETLAVTVGDPAPRTIRAPYTLIYASEIRTEEARLEAADQVDSIFTEADPQIGLDQIDKLQTLSEHITTILENNATTYQEKLRFLQDISEVQFSSTAISRILTLSSDEWNEITNEALRVLDLIMRDEITSETNEEAADRASRLISRAVSLEQNSIIYELIAAFITPNSFLDVDATLAAREQAQEQVDPVQVTVRENDLIVYESEIVDSLAIETMQQYGILQDTEKTWEDTVSGIGYALILVVILAAYILVIRPDMLHRPRRLLLFSLAIVTYAIAIRLMVPGHVLIPYLVPAAFVTMLMTILLDGEMGILSAVICGVILAFTPGASLELVTYAVLGSIVSSLGVRHIDNMGAFVKTAFYLFICNAAVVMIFRIDAKSYDTTGLLELLGVSGLNAAICSSLSFITFAITGRLFGISTFLQLLELARPTHPLLRQLSIKAPGTYHHSLIVANMAERAAQVVDADPLLARVGAYYHDIGKLSRPNFFAENQDDGNNPHDKLDPLTSARIIIAHVTDGMDLARQYRLSERVSSFINEHHGTTFASYFYRTACKQNPDTDIPKEEFCYPGPRPRSRETAIVMLADSIEAAVRARRPSSANETHELVNRIIQERLSEGQLAECDLTFADLTLIEAAFEDVLKGVFHPRVKYPEPEQTRA